MSDPTSLPTVWVVDDNPRDARLAATSLASTCRVRTFADGSSVLEQIATGTTPDLLVLDWVMPGVTGIDVVRFLRGEAHLPELPILLLTTHAAPDQIVEGLAAGANDYLVKPYNAAELQARAGALLRTAQLLRRALAAESSVRKLIASAPDALLVIDAQGRLNYANPEAGRVFANDPEALVGRRLSELVPELQSRNLTLGTGEALLPLPDVTIAGRVYAPSVRVLPTDTAANTTIALRDVTERRRTDQRRLDFYSIIAHDLRSPLQAVLLRTGRLLRHRQGQLSSEVIADVQGIERNLRSLVAMINDFLDLARLEGTGHKIAHDRLDLSEVVSATIEELAPLATAKGLQLDWRPPQDQMPVVGDRQRLSQVLSNLVGNAIKFTQAGGLVLVRLEAGRQAVEARVADNGPGIPPESLPFVFERYSRLTTHRGTIGSGLGLMIVREIIQAHGGTVGVESEVGQGSTFWFRLPREAWDEERAGAPLH